MMRKLLFVSIVLMSAFSSLAQNAEEYYKPSPENATVVFYRGSQLWRAAVNFTIRVDGVELCRLSNNRFLVYRTLPKTVNFTNVAGGLNIPDKEKLEMQLEAGKIYFVQCDIKSGFFTDRMEMTEVTESTAKRKMDGIKPDNCIQNK
jgi:hypothetical protein